MSKIEIKYYEDYISSDLRKYLIDQAKEYKNVSGLVEVGAGGGLEDSESLKFLCDLYDNVKDHLNRVLDKRIEDRIFIDERVKACYEFNKDAGNDFTTSEYKTIIGLTDSTGRIVVGPLREQYFYGNDKPVSETPDYLKGNHVTLFGPPDSAKLSINAMNAYHRKLVGEPAIVEQLLETHESIPKWGADDEDSKTPLRSDLALAGENLTACFEGTLRVDDTKRGKVYELCNEKRSLPIKRFPGLALPSSFLFYNGNPLPLHLYDFALHLFHNWHNQKALTFYVPKLENEEEAKYIKGMIHTAEAMINKLHPEYIIGSIRLLIVLENPRAVFRVNEIMDELYPYFAGASLGWHDYLGSTARLFKEDPNYRIPVKADPDIVIKHIKGSHQLLADVVGKRGGIKIGGMYGILPITNDIESESFQVSIFGFIKDVVTQMKRGLDGFWVAHPDFMRIGLALVEAWKHRVEGKTESLENLVKSLLQDQYHKEIFAFIEGEDIQGLNYEDDLYDRDLIVADIKESTYMRNNDPIEVRYNVFQSLQYLTDWLSGNGCVALPAIVGGHAVRVMDDLATAERSRWEVWHEINHGRFSVEDFLKIAHEEMHFIRKDLSNEKKIVQVKYDERTEKWYPIAFKLMLKLMTDKNPVEFATELLIPFGIDSIRESIDPWKTITEIDSKKYTLDSYVERYSHFFEMCGCERFAKALANTTITDDDLIQSTIMSFNKDEIIQAASFHGNIGESKKTLDHMAKAEQAKVFSETEEVKSELADYGKKYLEKYGVKFLVSAKGKSADEMLDILKTRSSNTEEVELENARIALLEITLKRLSSFPVDSLKKKINDLIKSHSIMGLSLCVSRGIDQIQPVTFGQLKDGMPVRVDSLFEIASLSKSVASAFAIEFFKERGISINSAVNEILSKTDSDFRLESADGSPREWADEVQIKHLMSHSALNMHYVNGVPANEDMPEIENFLSGNETYGYEEVRVINRPGTTFKYSGAGFIVLEYLIKTISKKSLTELTTPFLNKLGMNSFTFEQSTLSGKEYAHGHLDDGSIVKGTRKMFPAFAAGAMSNAYDVTKFLNSLTKSFSNHSTQSIISNDTAVYMLHGSDKGCQEFMGADMGHGIFIARAGLNKFALHQGANDGFRSLFVHCFSGPDLGKGFSLFCNNDTSAVSFLSLVSQLLLEELDISGIDYSKFVKDFDPKDVSSEEIVNFGYKNMVFNAFKPTLPEEIIDHGPIDPLSKFNKVVGSKVISVTNQSFARAENLFSPHVPVFDPTLFGEQGKVMDSWESTRHNRLNSDDLVFEAPSSFTPKHMSISTKWHLGNQAPAVSLEGMNELNQWDTILEKIDLDGHALKLLKLDNLDKTYKKFKVSIYPDGGLSRIGLFDDSLDADLASDFKEIDSVESILFPEDIPHTLKPMHIPFKTTEEEVLKRLDRLSTGDEYNCASSLYGAEIVSASNEHYGPASQVISPFPPISMFDGMESARSRKENHSEYVEIKLGHECVISKIEMDFTFFVNNNPLEIEVLFKVGEKWECFIPRHFVKGYAGKVKQFEIDYSKKVSDIKLITYPDGGLNRLKVFTVK